MFSVLTRNSSFIRSLHRSAVISMPKGKNKVAEPKTSTSVQTGPVSVNKTGIEIKILAKPGAKFNSVTDIGDTVGVQIAAPPVDGEANLELVKYLSKILGLKKSQVTLDKGTKSRNKTVLVLGSTKEDILQKLQEEKASS